MHATTPTTGIPITTVTTVTPAVAAAAGGEAESCTLTSHYLTPAAARNALSANSSTESSHVYSVLGTDDEDLDTDFSSSQLSRSSSSTSLSSLSPSPSSTSLSSISDDEERPVSQTAAVVNSIFTTIEGLNDKIEGLNDKIEGLYDKLSAGKDSGHYEKLLGSNFKEQSPEKAQQAAQDYKQILNSSTGMKKLWVKFRHTQDAYHSGVSKAAEEWSSSLGKTVFTAMTYLLYPITLLSTIALRASKGEDLTDEDAKKCERFANCAALVTATVVRTIALTTMHVVGHATPYLLAGAAIGAVGFGLAHCPPLVAIGIVSALATGTIIAYQQNKINDLSEETKKSKKPSQPHTRPFSTDLELQTFSSPQTNSSAATTTTTEPPAAAAAAAAAAASTPPSSSVLLTAPVVTEVIVPPTSPGTNVD